MCAIVNARAARKSTRGCHCSLVFATVFEKRIGLYSDSITYGENLEGRCASVRACQCA
jgi:hypothetical protein